MAEYRKKAYWHLELSINFDGMSVEKLKILLDVISSVPKDMGQAHVRNNSVVWSPEIETDEDGSMPFAVESHKAALQDIANRYPTDIKSIEYYGWKMTYFVDELIKPLKESETSVGNNE